MHINGVFQIKHSLFKFPLELLSVVIRQLILIIAASVKHSSKVLKFLVSPNVKVPESLDIELLENVIGRVPISCLLHLSIMSKLVIILHVGCCLSGRHPVAPIDDWHDTESVQQVNTNEYKEDQHDHSRGLLVYESLLQELVASFSLRSVVHLGGILRRSEQPLVGVHEDNHQKMEENGPFHKTDAVKWNLLVEVVTLSEELKQQVLVAVIA